MASIKTHNTKMFPVFFYYYFKMIYIFFSILMEEQQKKRKRYFHSTQSQSENRARKNFSREFRVIRKNAFNVNEEREMLMCRRQKCRMRTPRVIRDFFLKSKVFMKFRIKIFLSRVSLKEKQLRALGQNFIFSSYDKCFESTCD